MRRAQLRQQEAAGGASRSVGADDQVWYRKYLKGEKWFPGRVVDVLGPSNYKVLGDDGDTVHRHIDQLRKRPGNNRLSLAVTTTATEPASTDSEADRSAAVTPVRGQAESVAAADDPSRGAAEPARVDSASPASLERRFASPMDLPPLELGLFVSAG